eukprot:TRINITY_DN23371_c0_g1_i1.p2 TRINITY_DN23371_c0_g1~~TRINITY_DN23371_c0_g1_i1.p2  ORF type:complete len:101 (+),score=2.32 TRINITY_DN23371_c0_g1_i1:208-510(+)
MLGLLVEYRPFECFGNHLFFRQIELLFSSLVFWSECLLFSLRFVEVSLRSVVADLGLVGSGALVFSAGSSIRSDRLLKLIVEVFGLFLSVFMYPKFEASI